MQFSKLLFTAFISSVMAGSLTDLEIDITKRIPVEDCNVKATEGDSVSVHYIGKFLENGEVFDSSFDRNAPIIFKLGAHQVIQGWEQGILGMCVGEKRTIRIPSELAYGQRGIPGVIPADADMVFDVELVSAINK